MQTVKSFSAGHLAVVPGTERDLGGRFVTASKNPPTPPKAETTAIPPSSRPWMTSVHATLRIPPNMMYTIAISALITAHKFRLKFDSCASLVGEHAAVAPSPIQPTALETD